MGLADHDRYLEHDPALRGHWREQLHRRSPCIFRDILAVTELQDAWDTMLGRVGAPARKG